MSEIEHSFADRRRFLELNQLSLALPLGGLTCEILGWGFLGERWWRNYLHVHSFYEVCCAFDGEGIFRINGAEHVVRAGDLFVARPTEPHEIVSSEHAPLGIHYWSYILRQGASDATGDDRDLSALLTEFAHSPRRLSSETDAIQSTLALLTGEIAARAPGYKRNIAALAAKLIVDTARATTPVIAAQSIQPDVRTPHQQLVAQITRYLRDNFARPVTIRDVAAQVHLSERHVSRLFLQATGATIKDHVQALRIEAAAQRLIAGSDSIKAIGESTGFPDVQHFTTTFRRHTGLTPGAFRAQRGTRFADPSKPRHVQPDAAPSPQPRHASS